MRIRDLILPEDRVFLVLFSEMADKIAEASGVLNEITHELPDGTEKSHRIRQIEHQGDEITRKIFEQLDESLITPLEPEEIARLAPVLDDVLDRLDWVTHQLCNYEIPATNDVLKEFSYLILLASKEIAAAVQNLSSFQKSGDVRANVQEISRLFNLSTELLSRAILELFKTKDLLMIIKLKDIYEGMAKVMEKCNDVGHVLGDIAKAHA
jgi:predicted phosphate transport protein (TIGR00153 family)